MNYIQNESNRTVNPSSIRMRTFLVPLLGAALYYAGVIVVFFIAAILLGPQNTEKYQQGLNAIAMALLIPPVLIWVRFSRRYEGKKLFFTRITFAKLCSAVTVAFGLVGLTILYFLLVTKAAESAPFIADSLKMYEKMTETIRLGAIDKWIYVGTIVILVPVVEELIFRGIILHEFLSTMKTIPSVILASAVFAIVHIQPIQVGYAFFCGIIISAVYVLSRNIVLSILLHAVFNFLGSGLQTLVPEETKLLDNLVYIYFGAIVLSVAALIYLKKNKEAEIKTEACHASVSEG